MKRILLFTILMMSFCSSITFSNNTLLKDYFRTSTHIINRDTLKHYDGYSDRFYPYRLHNFDFLPYYEGGEWNNLVAGTFDLDSGRLAFASKDMNYFSNQGIEKMQKVCSDNHRYIYIIRNIYNPIKIFKAYFFNGTNSQYFIICDSFISSIYPKPLDIAINFKNTINDLVDDKIWAGANNNIMLLKYDTKDKNIFKRKSWYNIGGNSNERFTCIALGKDYGVQNNYIYVYDSLHNRVLRLYEDLDNYNQPTLTLVSSRTMPSDWIIKSITTDYFGSVWLSEYNHGYLQSYTPDLQQALTTANWSFRANKPVSFTMAMDKPYGILTEKWTNTTGVRLYKLGTEIFYDSVKQDNPLIEQIRLHFRVTVGSYITFMVGNTTFINNAFYLPGEYNRYFNTPYWSSGNKQYSLTARSACTNPDGTPTAVVTKTGIFNYYKEEYDVNLTGEFWLGNSPYTANSKVKLYYNPINGKGKDQPQIDTNYYYDIYKDGNRIEYHYDYRSYFDNGYFSSSVSHTYKVRCWYRYSGNYFGQSRDITVWGEDSTGCPYFYIKENGTYIPQNTIMHYGYNNKQDNYLFNLSNRYKEELRKNRITDNRFESKERVIESAISENEVEKDYIDRVNLKAVKYNSIYNLTLNIKGEYLFWKDVYKIDSCKNAKGEDILPFVENMGDSFYLSYPGDTIYIYTSTRCCDKANASGKDNRGGSIIIGPGVKPKDKGKGKDIEPSIEIEYTGGKSWVNCGEIYPREYLYASYNEIPLLSDSIRFVINNEVKIDYISFPKKENVKYNEINLKLINPTLKGKNVMKQIIKEDSVYINLISGDTLYFSFPLITPATREKVSYILETDGYYNIDNKRGKSESVTIPKSDIKFISGIVYLQSKCKIFSNYEIYNISGRQVGQGEIKTGKIKLQKLCRGIYFIKLKGEHRSETHKFEIIR